MTTHIRILNTGAWPVAFAVTANGGQPIHGGTLGPMQVSSEFLLYGDHKVTIEELKPTKGA